MLTLQSSLSKKFNFLNVRGSVKICSFIQAKYLNISSQRPSPDGSYYIQHISFVHVFQTVGTS